MKSDDHFDGIDRDISAGRPDIEPSGRSTAVKVKMGGGNSRRHGTKPKTQVLVGWLRSRTTTWNPHGPCDRPQRMICNANKTTSNWWNWLRELWDPAQGWFAFVGQILDRFELIFTPLKMKKNASAPHSNIRIYKLRSQGTHKASVMVTTCQNQFQSVLDYNKG